MNMPARGYSWPPFEPGHVASMTHGAFSPRKVDPLTEEIMTALISDPNVPDFVKHSAYRPALWGLARTEARIQLMTEWLDKNGHLDEKGMPRPAGDQLLRNERLAVEMRAKLGLDPSSRGRIERDLASAAVDMTLAHVTANGQRVRAEREEADREAQRRRQAQARRKPKKDPQGGTGK